MANVATGTVFYRKTAGTGAPEVQTLATLKADLGVSGTVTGTNTGDQTITLTGDVTGSGTGSFAATITAGAVSLAKMADVATGTLFYRKTAGTGAPEVQTLATLKTDLGLTGTNSGDQTITLTGDVTGTGTGSFAATIAAGSVSLSKMADVATGTLFYRKTAGTGAPEVQTLSTLKTDLGLTGTNSGDQTITLTGHVTGSGTGSFATTIATGVVTNAMLAGSIDISKLAITGTPTGLKFLRDDGSWQVVDGGGTGIASINGLTNSIQTFAVDSTGTDFSIASTGSSHTFNLPDAGATARGVVSTGVQTFAGNKTFSGTITASNLSGTNTGDQTITLTGDVTGTGTGSFAATIAAGSVSLAKMANVATATVFYRKTAGTGAPEVQTLATLKTDLGLTGTNSGDQTITLTGDVTGTGTGSFAATIASGAVSLSKMANVATATVFYRKTAGTGAPEVQTLATLKTDLGLTGTNSGDNSFATGTTGTDFNVVLSGNTITYHLPDAGATARGAVTTGAQTFAGNKTFSGLISASNLSGTNTGDQIITLTGDVTGNGTGTFAATIAASAVSLSKMANVATGTVFYRKTAGTGAPEVQTLATLKADLGLTGTNSGDQNLSSYLTISSAAATYQPVNTNLTAIAGLTTIADRFPYFTGSGTAALASVTSYTRNIIACGDADALWTNIGATNFDTNTANVFKLQNGTNRQTFELYNYITATDTLEGIRLKAVASANFELGTFNGSAAGSIRGLALGFYDRATPTVLTKWVDFVGSSGEMNLYSGLFQNRKFGDVTQGSQMIMKKYRGTEALSSALLTNDVIGQLLFQGYNGATIATSAAVQAQATADFSSTSSPTRLLFNTCDVDSITSTVRMVITEEGLLSLGTWSTSTPLSARATLLGNNAGGAENNTLRFHDFGSISGVGQVLGKIEFYSADGSAPGAGVKAWISGVCEVAGVANAGIAFATDTNTGTATEKVRIRRDGNVGIGTADPQKLLELSSSGGTTIRLSSTDTTASIGQQVGSIEFWGSDTDSGGVVGAMYCNYVLETGQTELSWATNTVGVAMLLSKEGRLGIGSGIGLGGATSPLDIAGNCLRVRTQRTPASAAASGNQGEWCNDSNYVYVCTAANTWKRAALSTW